MEKIKKNIQVLLAFFRNEWENQTRCCMTLIGYLLMSFGGLIYGLLLAIATKLFGKGGESSLEAIILCWFIGSIFGIILAIEIYVKESN